MEQKDVFLSFILGGIVGAGIALILAPQSGKETRERLVKVYKDSDGKVRERTHEVIGQVKEKAHEVSEKASEYKNQVAEGYHKVKDSASHAFEEGKKAFKESKESKESDEG